MHTKQIESTMTAHTPGPWFVSPRVNNMIDVIHVIHHDKSPGAITQALCRVQARPPWTDEAEHNARLIAAAPDLLAALRSLCDAIAHTPAKSREAMTAYEVARAAIAKATT